MRFLEACRKFISIDSSETNGTSELASFVEELALENGFQVEVQDEVHNGRVEKNVILRLEPKSETNKELLLQTHLDTAEPGIFSMWTKTGANPFSASIYGDTLYGLGAADTKLDFLCKFEALKKFKDQRFSKPVCLVGTFGAETGMVGAIKLIRRGKVNADRALIGQPTSMNLVTASTGIAVVEINIPFSSEEIEYHKKHDLMLSSSCQSKMFYGEGGHSWNPKLGENAIVEMMDYLSQLPDGIAVLDMEGGASFNSIPESAVIEFDLMGGFKLPTVGQKIAAILSTVKKVEEDFKNYPCTGFDPNNPTLNIGHVKKHRDHLRFKGCFRFPPTVNPKVYESWMKEINSACEEVGASYRIVDHKQSFVTHLESDFFKICNASMEKHCGEEQVAQTTTVCTEASVFNRMGMECLVFGPGSVEGNSYTANESISIEALEKSIKFYEQVISDMCVEEKV